MNLIYKKLTIVAALLFLYSGKSVYAQQKPPQIFTYVEQMPEFQAEKGDVNRFLARNLRYPEMAKVNDIEGRVHVKFIVDSTGNIADAVIDRSGYPVLDKEVLRIIKKMPKWKPGMQNGKPVNVYYTLPVLFRLDGAVPRKDQISLPYYLGDIEEALQVKDNSLGKGSAQVSVTINEDGILMNPAVIKATSKNFGTAAVKVVLALNPTGTTSTWKPAMQDGKPVSYKLILPVHFNEIVVRQ